MHQDNPVGRVEFIAPAAHQRGGALVEYTIVVSLLVVVLLADPNVIRDLADALRDAYKNFVYALSISWI